MPSFRPQKDIKNIIERYLSGKATAEETRFLESYYDYLSKNENRGTDTVRDLQNLEEENFNAIRTKIALPKRSKIIPFYKYASAAAILILICGGFYFLFNKDIANSENEGNLAEAENIDVLPGTDKAILTLADGTHVMLDDKTTKNISNKDGVTISKAKNGQLIYAVASSNNALAHKTVAYNTIQTPRGGQYQVLLPDGTKVWLNAASSLKYPESFVGNTRNVELSGEAYFEVAKNKDLPFHVKSVNQDVEVIGTHFNINGYMDDRTIKTTLLEGSVKVSNFNSAKILKPGEQAIADRSGNSKIRITSDVDTDDETAWKNGLFQFNDADLKGILNQLERWYDIKIDYSSVPNKRYNGMVPRKAKLSEVLKMLGKTGNIKFEIAEGKKLKVLR